MDPAEVHVAHQFGEEGDVLNGSVSQVYRVLPAGRRLVYQVVLHESINLLIFLKLLLHLALKVSADAFIAPDVHPLNVLVRLKSLHELLHFVVADGVVTQVDVLDAREFTYKLGQEV